MRSGRMCTEAWVTPTHHDWAPLVAHRKAGADDKIHVLHGDKHN